MYGFAYNYKKLQIYTYERMPVVYVCIYVCVCESVCVCLCVCVQRVSEYVYACKYMLVNLCMVLHTIIKSYKFIHTKGCLLYMCVCVSVCVCVCVCMCAECE